MDNDIKAAVAEFPPTFGLRHAPGQVFKIEPANCYMSDTYGMLLYTSRLNQEDGHWYAYAKGNPEELRAQVCDLPEGGLGITDGAK